MLLRFLSSPPPENFLFALNSRYIRYLSGGLCIGLTRRYKEETTRRVSLLFRPSTVMTALLYDRFSSLDPYADRRFLVTFFDLVHSPLAIPQSVYIPHGMARRLLTLPPSLYGGRVICYIPLIRPASLCGFVRQPPSFFKELPQAVWGEGLFGGRGVRVDPGARTQICCPPLLFIAMPASCGSCQGVQKSFT